jgi:pilus assembly protein Flp/PilA
MFINMISKLARCRRGQGLVEYAMIIAGVALVAAVGMTMFGHKTTDMIDAVAVVLPGAHTDDNGPITAGQLLELTPGGAGQAIGLDLTAIQAADGTARLGQNTTGNAGTGFNGLVVEPTASTTGS